MSKYELPIGIRQHNDDDLPYIYSTWSRSLHDDWQHQLAEDAKRIAGKQYFKLDSNWFWDAQEQVINKILKNADVLVACNPDHPEQTYGYIVYKDRHLHWIYTKYCFRKAGIANRLMESAFNDFNMPVTYATRTGSIRHHKDRWNLLWGIND